MDATTLVPMRLSDPVDPALQAASLALTGRAAQASSRFASIELRNQDARFSQFAPIGYVLTVIAALATILVLWTL
jgi:hypothetical protein